MPTDKDREFLGELFTQFTADAKHDHHHRLPMRDNPSMAVVSSEVVQLKATLSTQRQEVIRLRGIIKSMELSQRELRKAVGVSILHFPLVAGSLSRLADMVEDQEAKEIIQGFADDVERAAAEISASISDDRTKH